MNFKNDIIKFLDNIQTDKLFITLCPAFAVVIMASNYLKTNQISGFIAILAIVNLQIALEIFDDFYDWTSGKTRERMELENIGIRGNYKKCSYIYKDKEKPRKYFYFSSMFFTIFLFLTIFICYNNSDFKILLFLPIILLFCFINYIPKMKKLISIIGTETPLSILFGPITMLFLSYSIVSHIDLNILCVSIIFYFFIKNIFYTSSLLNFKLDISTKKSTIPIFFQTSLKKIYYSLFLTICPFMLTYLLILTKILPKFSYFTFLLLPHSLYFFYLIYLYEKSPEKQIKWHFLMGPNKNKTKDEQENLSWYYVRYNFIRNILVTYTIILTISLLNWVEILMP